MERLDTLSHAVDSIQYMLASHGKFVSVEKKARVY